LFDIPAFFLALLLKLPAAQICRAPKIDVNMLRNYLLLAVKHFRKQRLFSLINLLGLTTGITCCLMIFLFVANEFSYDNFHQHGKDIYRAVRVNLAGGVNQAISWLSPMYGKTLKQDYPDAIESFVRIQPDNDLISYKTIAFNEKKIYLADSNFFGFFSFRLLRGDPATVLKDPLSIVLTETTAKKYFGDEDPIGKVVDFDKKMKLKVTGIAADVMNSHLDFDMVVPISNWEKTPFFNQWPNNGVFTFVRLNPTTNPETLKKQFPAFMDKYLGKYYRESGFKMALDIQPLRGIYLQGESPTDPVRHGNRKMVYIFMSIALLILVIGCINFMNLATARAADRSREVGLRKVLGAVRRQLTIQFLFESLLFATIAAVLAIVLLTLLMPAYTDFLGYPLPSFWNNGWFYVAIASIILVVGFLAGSYPALLLSSFSPIESLKGKFAAGRSGAFFRKALVIFQFGISVLLIISVTIVMNQMHYVLTTDLGFSKEQSMIVRLDNWPIWQKRDQFKKALESDPAVASVSLMTGEPGGFHDVWGFEAEGKPGEKLPMSTEFADFEYARTLGLKFIAGRDFSAEYPTDSTKAVVVNRTAAAVMGYTPAGALGKWVKVAGDSNARTVVGVVEDYHFHSLKQVIGPLVISPGGEDRRLALIKLRTADYRSAIGRLKNIYASSAADYPFEYSFLDDTFDKLYQSDARQETLLSIFALIAIGVACLGLFGLASFTALKRTKEIGVRKVLGSSVKNVVMLLLGDLLKPVLIGTMIAIPVGYWIMQKWLQGFVYRTTVHWWLFVLAAMIALLVAAFTVSIQSIKAALVNPARSLKTE
jgi:putative ABC transport system permease protein